MTCVVCDGVQEWDVTVGDTAPPLSGHLENADGTRPDLTGASLALRLIDSLGATVQNLAAMLVDDPLTAQFHYQWVAGDTDAAGTLRGRIRVTYPSTSVEWFPTGGYFLVRVGA